MREAKLESQRECSCSPSHFSDHSFFCRSSPLLHERLMIVKVLDDAPHFTALLWPLKDIDISDRCSPDDLTLM
jgi:hypothetical protein